MILRELLCKGPQGLTVPAGCYQNFYQMCTISDKFINNELLLIKFIKKIIYGNPFYWFVLLIKLINYQTN